MGDVKRQITIVNSKGDTVFTSEVELAKNAPCISSVELPEAGTYYLGSVNGNNYFFKVLVTDGAPAEVERADWTGVNAPVITGAVQKGG